MAPLINMPAAVKHAVFVVVGSQKVRMPEVDRLVASPLSWMNLNANCAFRRKLFATCRLRSTQVCQEPSILTAPFFLLISGPEERNRSLHARTRAIRVGGVFSDT